MTYDRELPDADAADLAEQEQDVLAPDDDQEVPDVDPGEPPMEADEADVAEQRTEVPGGTDEDVDEI
jgi:hypothetical protein